MDGRRSGRRVLCKVLMTLTSEPITSETIKTMRADEMMHELEEGDDRPW